MPDIVVIGSLNMDLVATASRLPVSGETIIGDHYFAQPGGKGANQAYAAARLGGSVAMIGCVGNDELGRRMCDNLASVGCDIKNVHAESGASGVALIFVSSTGQNSIIVVSGANSKLQPGHVAQAKDSISSAKIVLLQLESPLPTVIAAAKTARECGATVILDPAPAPVGRLPIELIENVDVLTPNEIEAANLTGRSANHLDPAEAARVGLELCHQGMAAVIVKLGDKGCIVISGDDEVHLPAPTVIAVDTTAAGDVFNGALAVALSEGKALTVACEFANRAAALSVTRRGAQAAVPDRREVDILTSNAAAQAVNLTQ
jgi:ribokinase